MDWIAGEDNTEALKSASDEAWAAIEDTESCITDEESDAMLRQVLSEFCAEEQIADQEARENIARHLVNLYQLGVRCPERLMQAMRSGARTPVA